MWRGTLAEVTPRAEPWTLSESEGEARFELAPAGLGGGYRSALLVALFLGVGFGLPLGSVGLVGALAWADFPTALRIAMGVFGGAAVAASLGLPIRLVLAATSRRARVRVLPGGVFVEVGSVRPSRAVWLAPRREVKLVGAAHDPFAHRGLVLACASQTIGVGFGMDGAAAHRLIAALRAALEKVPAEPFAGTPPETRPLGPPWGVRLRGLAADLLRPLRRPTSFLLLDLGALVGVALLEWVFFALLDRGAAYPAAYALFLVGLAARWFDGSYLDGLRRYGERSELWGFYYMLAGAALGLAGIGVGVGLKLPGAAIFLPGIAAVGLHAALLRRARRGPPPPPRRALDLALALTLIPISVLHEAAMFTFLADGAEDLGPLALSFIPPTVVMAYLPVRLHAFVDAPDDRSNVAWFWLTAGLLTLRPLASVVEAL